MAWSTTRTIFAGGSVADEQKMLNKGDGK